MVVMVVVVLLYTSLLNVRGEMNEGDQNILSCIQSSESGDKKADFEP